MNETVVTFTS